MSDLFLSYARCGDKAFVRRLYDALTEDGFAVWFDCESMPSRSLTFLHEIRAAIDSVGRVLVVVDQSALTSDYVRAEWQHAQAAEKVVIPILRDGKHEDLPAEFRNFHAIDFRATKDIDKAYVELRRVLSDPIPPLGPLYGDAPKLPPHFQPRPDDLARVAEFVLVDLMKPVNATGPDALVVIHGMAGAGKSVLAAAFARSTAARRSFPSGVFWLSVGEEANGLTIVRRLGAMLPDSSSSHASVEAAKTALRRQLAGKRALVVLDDVRSVEQLEVLLGVSDVNTRIVVTTTDAELVIATGGRGVPLTELTEEAALRLLADWVGTAVDLLPSDAGDLARMCVCHPLALALNGAMLAGDTPCRELIDALRKGELDFADVRLAFYPHPTVRQSLQVSMDSLTRRDPIAAERFRELAALHWVSGVPEAAIARLWQHRGSFTKRHTIKLISQLEQRSLVRTEGTAPDRRVRIHGLQLTYLHESSTNLVELNRAVVAAYRDACSGNWPSGPADGYFHQNLIHHLVSAGFDDQVHQLLAVEAEGRNAWFQAKTDLGIVASYFEDIDRALALVIDAPQTDIGLRLELNARYALITASIQSRAKQVPPGLLGLCVQNGVLSLPAALSFARAASLKEQYVGGLGQLIPYSEEGRAKLESEAINIAMSVDEPDRQVSMLGDLIPSLSPPQASLVFNSTRCLGDDDGKLRLIALLAERVPPATFDDLLMIVSALPDSVNKVRALVAVSKRAPGVPTTLSKAEVVVKRFTDPFEKVLAIALVVPVLHVSRRRVLIATALAMLKTIETSDALAQALATIAPTLSESQLGTALELALTRTANNDGRFRALFGIVPFLPVARRNEVVMRQIKLCQPKPGAFPWGERYVAILASDLPEPERAEVLVSALPSVIRMATLGPRRMRWPTWEYVAALEVLARRLPNQYVRQAIDAVHQVSEAEDRAALLGCLAPRLSSKDRRPILQAELERVLTISDAAATASTLAALSALVPKHERRELAEYCLDLVKSRGGTLGPQLVSELVPHLRGKRAREIVTQEVNRIEANMKGYERGLALAALVPAFGSSEIRRAAELARTTLEDHSYLALATLAGSLESDDRHLALEQILSTASGWVATELPSDYAQALHFTVPLMSPKQIEAALEIANKIGEYGGDVYAEVIRWLAPKLSAAQIDTVRKNLSRLENPAALVVAWVALANNSRIPVAERKAFNIKAREACASINEPASSARALRILASIGGNDRLGIVQGALDAARKVAEDDERARILCELLDVLPPADALMAFGEMAKASLGVRRAGAGVTRFYEGLGRPFLLRQFREAASWLGSFDDPGCVSSVVRAVQDVVRWWP